MEPVSLSEMLIVGGVTCAFALLCMPWLIKYKGE